MDTEDIKQPSLWIPMSEPINMAHIGKPSAKRRANSRASAAAS